MMSKLTLDLPLLVDQVLGENVVTDVVLVLSSVKRVEGAATDSTLAVRQTTQLTRVLGTLVCLGLQRLR